MSKTVEGPLQKSSRSYGALSLIKWCKIIKHIRQISHRVTGEIRLFTLNKFVISQCVYLVAIKVG